MASQSTDEARPGGGDRLAVIEGPNGAWAVAWQTTWDTDADAAAFETAACKPRKTSMQNTSAHNSGRVM